jgi:outer membrane lipoprotein SlyB
LGVCATYGSNAAEMANANLRRQRGKVEEECGAMSGIRRQKRFLPLLVGLTLAVSACAQTYHPVVDMQGVDPSRYAGDLSVCRQYATQVSPAEDALIGTLAGGLLGAALGAATGAAVGAPGTGAAIGAAALGIGGLGGGVAHGVSAQMDIIRNCMRGRGYAVLN